MPLRLFLAGDVMTGRGIDQILPHPSEPTLHEPYATSAVGYVALAERANGPIPRRVTPAYVWGDLLADLAALRPDLRFGNLETAVTRSDRPEPKGINYRMHPDNVSVLAAAGFDGVSLANNHVLDWSRPGLAETLRALDGAGIGHAGAGADEAAAEAPLVLDAGAGRLVVLSLALEDSGVPPDWAASADRPGVALVAPDPARAVATVRRRLVALEGPRRPVLVSIHWGGNWGFDVPAAHREMAHALIDAAGVDVVHGHSAHHPKAVELHGGRAILYGCGDLLNDYEGIGGHSGFRHDLVLAYLLEIDAETGAFMGLEMLPYRLRRFRLARVDRAEPGWLHRTMRRGCRAFGAEVMLTGRGTLRLRAPE